MLQAAINPNWTPDSFCGEEPGHPWYETHTGGGVTTHRRLLVNSEDVLNWYLYFVMINPLDPYTNSAVAWDFHQQPFEKQERVAGGIAAGYADYEFSQLDIMYEGGPGYRYIPGCGVVHEEMKPRLEQEPIGIARQQIAASGSDNLVWATNDSNVQNFLYYGEHPHFESGGMELVLTFPFAGVGNEPWLPGTINSDTFTTAVGGSIFAPGTLKYVGMTSIPSVVIPAAGIYAGVMRYRVSFHFHFRCPANAAGNIIDWNMHWRARDQTWGYMKDATGAVYKQYPAKPFGTNLTNLYWIPFAFNAVPTGYLGP